MQEFLIGLIVAVWRILFPAIRKKSVDTFEESKRRPELKHRLIEKIRRRFFPLMVIFVLLNTTGCFTRTVYIPHGEPVRIRETIRDAKIIAVDKDGNHIKGTMDIPEGWYCLPLSDEDVDDGKN